MKTKETRAFIPLSSQQRENRCSLVVNFSLIAFFTVCLITMIPSLGAASDKESRPKDDPDPNKKFKIALIEWAEIQNINLGESFTLDRRFKAVDCKGNFRFVKKRTSESIVKASCDAPLWERHIKAKGGPKKTSAGHGRSTAHAYVIAKRVEKGEKLSLDFLEKKLFAAKRLPKNYLKSLPTNTFFARFTLGAGRILTDSDIFQPEVALVVTETILRGTEISPALVEKRLVNFPVAGSLIKDKASLKFFESNKTLLPGTPLQAKDLRKAKLVSSGDSIIVSSTGDGFSIKRKSAAMEDGYLYDQIRLSNEDGSDSIQAIVTGRNTARAIK